MTEFNASIEWQRGEKEAFSDNQFSRGHTWAFDGGVQVSASSSPHVVPIPYSIAESVDPEEAFIAALSSCHMLTFLAIAAKKKFVIDTYRDIATGVLEQDRAGKSSVTRVTLRPNITFSGQKQPTTQQLDKMHHLAHQNCFIANSVKTRITIEARASVSKRSSP
ncbi:OsmC family protein [Photobacterium atrarenae]|uniref:OsmC family protein n=1 Tax=Photobacterium atrarenae TaxID=865757 RepID=A0ABY5GIN9_9GAMM|nr:OsmC family protein [Photobacterium atrarenae]UTV29134.1 OsmC family protein [Photobacterium atrarenae]